MGGKNASLGELFNSLRSKGVGVLDGFATTADAYRSMLAQGALEYELRSLLSDFDYEDVEIHATPTASRSSALRCCGAQSDVKELITDESLASQ